MEKKPSEKILKILIIVGIVLIPIGIGLLVFFWTDFLKISDNNVGNIQKNVFQNSPPSTSSGKLSIRNLKLATSSSTGSYKPPASALKPLPPNQFKLEIQKNIETVFSDSKYGQIKASIDLATNETDPAVSYQDYKKTYDLIAAVYKQTADVRMKYILIEIRVYGGSLPNFKDADMPAVK